MVLPSVFDMFGNRAVTDAFGLEKPQKPPKLCQTTLQDSPQGPAKPPRPTQNRQGADPETTKTILATPNLHAKPLDGKKNTPEGPKTSQMASEDPRFALEIDP